MKAERIILAVVLTACALRSQAQERPAHETPAPTAPAATNVLVSAPAQGMTWLALSNDTVAVIAKTRGVKPESVRLDVKSSTAIGPFEIDLAGATNCAVEAEMLSSKLGTNFTVVLEEASLDGQMRTNHTFRNGSVRKLVAPPGQKTLSPGERRLVVWPDSTRPAPPTNFRIAK